MFRKKILSLALASTFMMSMFSGCLSNDSKPATQDGGQIGSTATTTPAPEKQSENPKLIKVASVTPLSGSQAALGETVKNGAQMAYLEQVTTFASLGFTLEYEPQDDQADPKIGVSVAQKLVSAKDFLGLVGHFNSGVAIPSSEVYKTDNLTMVSPSNTAVEVTDRNILSVNRICSRDDIQGPVASQFMYEALKVKNLFVLHDKTAYGQGIADQVKASFTKLGGKVIGFEGFAQKETDFSGLLTKIKTTNPDAVFFGGIYNDGGLFVKQMREKGLKAKFVGPDGLDNSDFVNIGGKAVVDSYYTSVAAPIANNQKANEWVAKFKEKFGKAPENYSLYGYDAMNVLLDGIKAAIKANNGVKPSRLQVAEAVRATKGFVGLATKVTFDARGDNEDAGIFIYKFNEAKYPAPLVKSIEAKPYLKK